MGGAAHKFSGYRLGLLPRWSGERVARDDGPTPRGPESFGRFNLRAKADRWRRLGHAGCPQKYPVDPTFRGSPSGMLRCYRNVNQ